MHIETSVCGTCGFLNYNWGPLPSCEHYLLHNYDRTKADAIWLEEKVCHILALDFRRIQRFKGQTNLIDPEIWRQKK